MFKIGARNDENQQFKLCKIEVWNFEIYKRKKEKGKKEKKKEKISSDRGHEKVAREL